MVPPSDRCRYKTDKLPTGPFERKKLLEFLERKAREDKDWEEAKPFKKETRGIVIVLQLLQCLFQAFCESVDYDTILSK